MTPKEDEQAAFVKGYRAGWTQCIKMLVVISATPKFAVDRITTAMKITEKTFVPRPFKDDDRSSGKDAYSEERSSEGEQ